MNCGKIMKNQNNIPDNIIKTVINSFNYDPRLLKTDTPYRIKINGKYIKTMSGKTLWKTLGHAKSALNNHISNLISYRRYSELNEDIKILEDISGKEKPTKIVIDFLIKNNIVEFVPFTPETNLKNDYEQNTFSELKNNI